MEDIESNLNQEELEGGTSDLFELESLDYLVNKTKIESIVSSEKYLYLLTQEGGVKRLQNNNEASYRQLYSLPESKHSSITPKKYNSKIFCDRIGNHCIIKYGGRMYYFNSAFENIHELSTIKSIDVCAIGFDPKNDDNKSTGDILLSDSDNKIYSYKITIDKAKKIREDITELIQLEKKEKKDDRDIILGIEVYLYFIFSSPMSVKPINKLIL